MSTPTASQTADREQEEHPRRESAAASTRSSKSSNSRKSSKDAPSTQESLQVRLTRKRAAETTEDKREGDEQDADLQTNPSHVRGNSGDSADSARSVCLCQPDPKIPRPRNAFILYRQHHQAAVASQNPGLANPEISKIIGEQWRSQPASVKSEWKQLAEEEKLRHQQQYPDYRYRPRRNDQRGSISDPNGRDWPFGNQRCQKCGGRSLTTTSPNASSAPQSASLAQSIHQSRAGLPATPVTQYLPLMDNLTLATPRGRRPRGAPAELHINPTASRQRMSERAESPFSSESKRRRYTYHQPQYFPGRITATPSTPFFTPPPNGIMHPMQVRRESLPPPADLYRTSPTSSVLHMGPPTMSGRRPPTLPMSPLNHDTVRQQSWDRMDLTLPPLQTAASSGNAEVLRPSAAPLEDGTLRGKRSVEATIMGMPYLGKLRMLRKISPPVGSSATPPSPVTAVGKGVTGAIVAVEGFNRAAVSELSNWLDTFLARTNEFDVKLWSGPRVPEWKTISSLDDVLGVVREWHAYASEMIDFVRSASIETTTESGRNRDDSMEDAAQKEVHSVIPGRAPVLLFNTFALQACDRYACTIPIQDTYTAADHWQWMATLWRGIPSADIVVYIKEVESVPPPTPEGADKKNVVAKTSGDREKIGTVEIVEEPGLKCLVVWKERGKEVEGSTLRRLGFELSEWIRSVGTV